MAAVFVGRPLASLVWAKVSHHTGKRNGSARRALSRNAAILPETPPMRLILVLLALMAAGSGSVRAAAGAPNSVPNSVPDSVPLPRPRPAVPVAPHIPRDFAESIAGLDLDLASITSEPTPCDQRLEQMAKFVLMPRLIGPGACGGRDLVRLEAVLLPDKTSVAIAPKALLTCPMAESLAAWLRDAVVPPLAKMGGKMRGARLASIENYDSYECRTRNRITGAKLSEHAHGDAIDVRAFRLADGRRLELTDPKVDKPMRVAWRDAACHRFTTVLGPGDAYHSGHVHLDVIARRNGYRICQWEVRVPAPKPAVPLPRPRPAAAAAPIGRGVPAGKGPTL